MQDYASDISRSLLASFRIWQLAPSEENRLALLAACRARIYTAPASQIRYCVTTAGGETPEAATLSRAISTLLAARESDERLSRSAMFLVPPAAFSEQEGLSDWTWRSQRLGDTWYVFACAPAGPSDDTGIHPVAVVFLETASLTNDLVAPLVNIQSKSEKAKFSIAERGRWHEAPSSDEEAATHCAGTFRRAAWISLSIIVIDADNTLGDLARERVRLLTWTFVLAGIGVVVGNGDGICMGRQAGPPGKAPDGLRRERHSRTQNPSDCHSEPGRDHAARTSLDPGERTPSFSPR